MLMKSSVAKKIFNLFNQLFLIAAALSCILPLIHVFAISLSGRAPATAGLVGLWPVDFTTISYEFVLREQDFLRSLLVSFKRVALGVPINMLLMIVVAYPLSKSDAEFRWRRYFVWFFLITILFSGGLIPWFLVINSLRLIDTLWALVLPGGLPVFSMILLSNFFRTIPREIEESAFIDGASHFKTLWSIYVPLSKPALASLALFCIVAHWNAWFDGLILMNRPSNFPMQSYLQTMVVDMESIMAGITDFELLSRLSDRTLRSAKIFLGSLPVLMIYPFLQRYFITGIILGSVKG